LHLGLAGGAVLAAATPALGNHSALERVSVGHATGFAAPNASFAAATEDGSRVFFAVASGDVSNGSGVLYERSGGVTTLISANGAGQPREVQFDGMSEDGDHVFFRTRERLTPEDGEIFDHADTYERFEGVTRLVTTGPTDPHDEDYFLPVRISDDGAHAFFVSADALVAGDTDAERDVYERSGSTTTLVSARPDGTNGGADTAAFLSGITSDGARVFFETAEALVPEDTDTSNDLYERVGGTTTMVTDWDTAFGLGFVVRAISSDGTRVIVGTRKSFDPGDTDNGIDLYELADGQHTLLSTGSTGGAEAADANFAGATSDATAVWFTTFDRLTSDDVDEGPDLYKRQGGATTLISAGPGAGAATTSVKYLGQGGNGERTLFQTYEQLVPEDVDTSTDIYERHADTTSLLSTGPLYAGENIPPIFQAASRDGSRVFFGSTEGLVPGTTSSGYSYVYERFAGVTYLVGRTPLSNFADIFGGASPNGTTVYFNTLEDLGDDANGFRDAYATRVAAYARPKGATPMRVALVPAFQQCAAPNRTHGAPLAFPSCTPPVPGSSDLTLGGNDGTLPARAIGFVHYRVLGTGGPPGDADLRLQLGLTNVMHASSLADYGGSLRVEAEVRRTDTDAGTSMTSQDFPFGFSVPCTPTADPATGSACPAVTTANAVVPGSVPENARSVWALDRVKVFDGGADGDPGTAPNGLLAVQGLFLP
jgi:hypothetical protein